MWKKKIKIGFIDIGTSVNGYKNQTHTYKVKIVHDLGDKYEISFGDLVQGSGQVNNLTSCLIFDKKRIYGIEEVELNWFERNFYQRWSFGRIC
jgi:hypothetical protein